MAKDIPIFDFDLPKTKTMFKQYIGSLEGVWEVEFTKRQKGRSLKANAYYWAEVVPCVIRGIKNQWGYTLDKHQAHELCLNMFSGLKIVDKSTGEEHVISSKRSRKMNVEEFSEFLNHVMKFAADLGEYVRSPGEITPDEKPRLRQAVGTTADGSR